MKGKLSKTLTKKPFRQSAIRSRKRLPRQNSALTVALPTRISSARRVSSTTSARRIKAQRDDAGTGRGRISGNAAEYPGYRPPVIMAVFAHQVSQPHHFATMVKPVVVEIWNTSCHSSWVLSVISASSCHRLSFITRINTLSVSSS